MPRRHLFRSAALVLAAVLIPAVFVRCNYTPSTPLILPGETVSSTPGSVIDPSSPAKAPLGAEETQEKTAILDNVIKLIQAASVQPGGGHFGNATKNLNQYFEGTSPTEFTLDAPARKYLETQHQVLARVFPPERMAELESSTWRMPDARHLEDCMLYQGIASRVGGVGDDLVRARRVFDWMVQQIQLVPAGSLSAPGLGQAQARPYDVLLRGLATEGEGSWSERGWLFISLCRQLGLDSGFVTYTPPGANAPILWCVAVLIDKKPYLFDPRIGLPIPDAKGDGVATLDEAMTNPVILDRLDLNIANQPAYTTRTALLGSPSKIGILIDSSLHYFAPRMKLLQQSLAGKNLTILYRDPAEQRERFAEALGDRLGSVHLWELPIQVEWMLFHDARFVEATQGALSLFRPELPLVYARIKQLRGEIPDAINAYVDIRLKENATLMDQKTPMPPEVQSALDVYATYFLGLCQLDNKNPGQARFFFARTLQMLPEPGPRRLYYYMFRWGAQSNLGLLSAARGDHAKAIAYYSQDDPTAQRHGNLLRARDLVWLDPTAPSPEPLPPAPPEPSGPEKVGSLK